MFLHRMEMSNFSLDLDFPFLVVCTSCWFNRVSDGQGFSNGLCFVCLLGMALFSFLCQTRPIIVALCLVFMFSLVTTQPICQCFRLSRKFSWDLFFCGPLEGIAFYSAPNPNCSAVKSSWPIRPQKRSEVRNLEDLTDVTVRGWNYCRKWVHNTFSPNSLLLGFLMQLEIWPPWCWLVWSVSWALKWSCLPLSPIVSGCLPLCGGWVLVGVAAFLGSEVVLSPVVSGCGGWGVVGVAASRTKIFGKQNHRFQSKFAYCKLFGVYAGVILCLLQEAMHSCRIIYHTYLLYRLWYTVWCTFWLYSINIRITVLIITINHHYTRYIRYLLGMHSLDSS